MHSQPPFSQIQMERNTDVAERKYGFDPEDAKSFPDNLFRKDIHQKIQISPGM